MPGSDTTVNLAQPQRFPIKGDCQSGIILDPPHKVVKAHQGLEHDLNCGIEAYEPVKLDFDANLPVKTKPLCSRPASTNGMKRRHRSGRSDARKHLTLPSPVEDRLAFSKIRFPVRMIQLHEFLRDRLIIPNNAKWPRPPKQRLPVFRDKLDRAYLFFFSGKVLITNDHILRKQIIGIDKTPRTHGTRRYCWMPRTDDRDRRLIIKNSSDLRVFGQLKGKPLFIPKIHSGILSVQQKGSQNLPSRCNRESSNTTQLVGFRFH